MLYSVGVVNARELRFTIILIVLGHSAEYASSPRVFLECGAIPITLGGRSFRESTAVL